jgi:signal transduction histidine kinase
VAAHPNHRQIFGSAIFLLVACGLAAGLTLYRMYSGEQWVRHTYQVQLLLSEIDSTVGRSGRLRQTFLQTGDTHSLQEASASRPAVFADVATLRGLVSDNPDQVRACDRLQELLTKRFDIFDQSLATLQTQGRSGPRQDPRQEEITGEIMNWTSQVATIVREMKDVEIRLLDRRQGLTSSLVYSIVAILAFAFLLSIYMLWSDYRVLDRELAQRRLAEHNAQQLSTQLLRAQDQERRKIARELHDGLGQNLAAAKMIADSFLHRAPDKEKLQELSDILDDSVSSTRTISHLLHPPLLDEVGFASAARSYLEGFSRRTGVKINFDFPENEGRLPRDLELTLFRVLQECLTNIQRHSRSARADVKFAVYDGDASLLVRDYGVGLPPETFQGFTESGSNVGVGLAGMKERIREQRGKFNISSDPHGTSISAILPIPPDATA